MLNTRFGMFVFVMPHNALIVVFWWKLIGRVFVHTGVTKEEFTANCLVRRLTLYLEEETVHTLSKTS